MALSTWLVKVQVNENAVDSMEKKRKTTEEMEINAELSLCGKRELLLSALREQQRSRCYKTFQRKVG